MFGLKYIRGSLMKRLAMKTTNAIVISGIAFGIGSAIFLSVLKYLFGKSQKLELPQNHEDEVTSESKNDTPVVLFIATKKSQHDVTTQPSLDFVLSSSSSSSLGFGSLASSSSTNQTAVDGQVSEIEIQPLQNMLLNDECPLDKLQEDYMVLVMPKGLREQLKQTEDWSMDEEQFHETKSFHGSEHHSTTPSSFTVKRHSFGGCTETVDDILGKSWSLHRCSFPRTTIKEEPLDESDLNQSTEDDEGGRRGGGGGGEGRGTFEENSLQGAAVPFFCPPSSSSSSSSSSFLATPSLDASDRSDLSFLLTSADMRSIFEDERTGGESLVGGGSDVMEKLADIEEKLSLVHVDAEDMMRYLSAFRDSEEGGGGCPTPIDSSTPSSSGESTTPTYRVEEEEWSFEDQLGDPNDISF